MFHYPIAFGTSNFKDLLLNDSSYFTVSLPCAANPCWAASFKSQNPGSTFMPNIVTEQILISLILFCSAPFHLSVTQITVLQRMLGILWAAPEPFPNAGKGLRREGLEGSATTISLGNRLSRKMALSGSS